MLVMSIWDIIVLGLGAIVGLVCVVFALYVWSCSKLEKMRKKARDRKEQKK